MNTTSTPHPRRQPPQPEQLQPANIEAERTMLCCYGVCGAWRDDVTAQHFAYADRHHATADRFRDAMLGAFDKNLESLK